MKKIFFAIVLLIPPFLYYASTQPDTYSIARTVVINAAPEKVFPLINNFHSWSAWTPYNKDPAMKKLFTGSPEGIGASYAWEGNHAVGKGEITITDSSTPNKIVLDLHMAEPFRADNVVTFTLAKEGNSTQVTWAMDCKQTLWSKALTVLRITDYMVGKDFEAGLAKLKIVAEKQIRS